MDDGRPRLSLSLNPDVIKDNIPASIVPGIWLGSIHSGFHLEGLTERRITHIINLSGLPATFPKTFSYLSIEIPDKPTSDILSVIPATNIFIEAALESGGEVLVHCMGGRSRSPAIIIAFMMSTMGMTYDRCVGRVRAARNVVALNQGFEIQLRAYATVGCDVYKAHQLLLHTRMLRVSRAKRRRSEMVFGRTAWLTPSVPFEDSALPVGKPVPGSGAPGVSLIPLCIAVQKPAQIRLSRPHLKPVHVIPPLRGSDDGFLCRHCDTELLRASSILQHSAGKNPVAPKDFSWMYPDVEEDESEQGDADMAGGDSTGGSHPHPAGAGSDEAVPPLGPPSSHDRDGMSLSPLPGGDTPTSGPVARLRTDSVDGVCVGKHSPRLSPIQQVPAGPGTGLSLAPPAVGADFGCSAGGGPVLVPRATPSPVFPVVAPVPSGGFGGGDPFGAPSGPSVPRGLGKSKSFAGRPTPSFDAFNFGGGSAVPPTPSHRRGRGSSGFEDAKKPLPAFGSPIHEEPAKAPKFSPTREEDEGADDDDDVHAAVVEDDGDIFAPSAPAPSMSLGAFGGRAPECSGGSSGSAGVTLPSAPSASLSLGWLSGSASSVSLDGSGSGSASVGGGHGGAGSSAAAAAAAAPVPLSMAPPCQPASGSGLLRSPSFKGSSSRKGSDSGPALLAGLGPVDGGRPSSRKGSDSGPSLLAALGPGDGRASSRKGSDSGSALQLPSESLGRQGSSMTSPTEFLQRPSSRKGSESGLSVDLGPVALARSPMPQPSPLVAPGSVLSASAGLSLVSPASSVTTDSGDAVPPMIQRQSSAEKTRWLEKMRWLEETKLEPGSRRSDDEAARTAGGSGSGALSRKGLRRVRSSSVMQVAAADEAAATLSCDHVFVEPLQWMGELRGRSGALHCPNAKCAKQLGVYDWTGLSCSCNAVVTPAFCIDLRHVKRVPYAPPPTASRPASPVDKP